MASNYKLVGDLVEANMKVSQGSYAYVLGMVEFILADTLTELEINHPKTYQARVEYITRLIQAAKEKTND